LKEFYRTLSHGLVAVPLAFVVHSLAAKLHLNGVYATLFELIAMGLVALPIAALVFRMGFPERRSGSRRRKYLKQECTKAAHDLGAERDAWTGIETLDLKGVVPGVTVHLVEDLWGSLEGLGLVVRAIGDGRIPADLAIAYKPTYIERSPRLHDPSVDLPFEIKGPDDLIFAVMSKRARDALSRLSASGLSVGSGEVSLHPSRQTHAADIVELTREAAGLAQLLSIDRSDIPTALAANAAIDSLAEVRLRCLQLLLERDSKGQAEQDGKTRQAAQRAIAAGLKDADATIRLEAASHAGAEGFAVLASLVGDESSLATLRARALKHLATHFPYPHVAPQVARALNSGDAGLLEVAVEAAGAGHDRPTFERICELSQMTVPRLAEAAAGALGKLGEARAEPALLNLLRHESPDVCRAAARALGEVGTVEAVAPLMSVAADVRSAASKDAARHAIRKIQGRLGDIDAGRLAVVGLDDAGAGLSLVDQGGEVSLAEQKSGELSPAPEHAGKPLEGVKG
jgi:HEAT repeat protein